MSQGVGTGVARVARATLTGASAGKNWFAEFYF